MLALHRAQLPAQVLLPANVAVGLTRKTVRGTLCCFLWQGKRSLLHCCPVQAVSVSASLEEMHRCRAKYLRAVTRYCLLR